MTDSATQPGGPTPAPPARAELPKQYKPTDHENRIRSRWESSGAFHPDPERVIRGEAKPYCIVIPPPNVTDRLHLGHALNNTLQDVLIRAHRMMGYETLWMPGTDHAGIATQAVVEKRLRKEGKLKGPLRESMKREEFIATVQAFKDEYEATITGQLKAMGCSCDWERQRFTMDEQCAAAVYEAFFRLFKDGLIYRGKRLVNWDPVLQTAVADDECYEEEVDAQFYYLRYPLVHPHGAVTNRELARGKTGPEDAVPVTWSELRARGWPGHIDAEHQDEKEAWVTVATTRPETYLGDTAVAVNPRDPRAKALRGLNVELPLVGRIIPIVEDDYVVLPAAMQADPEAAEKDPKARFATGFLKVTPAHDPNDYEIGIRHKLEKINIFAPDASISDKHGWSDVGDAHILVGKKREDARKLVVKEFEARGLFERAAPYRHSVKHSDRSKAVIEPYLSDQWYVKVTDEKMRGSALRAMTPDQRTAHSSSGTATVRERTPKATKDDASSSAASDGDLCFYPSRYAKTFEMWHEGIRDWCISRQLWWGHQIPVWRSGPVWVGKPDLLGRLRNWQTSGRLAFRYESDPLKVAAILREPHPNPQKAASISDFDHAKAQEPATFFVCPRNLADKEVVHAIEAAGLQRDPDVLDTWFSSGLWPISTMGWPNDTPLLRAFNPSSTLCTAREIITLWVSRMVMFNRYLMPDSGSADPSQATGGAPSGGRQVPLPDGRGSAGLNENGRGTGPLPFRDVFIHALIMDGAGQKMSKSLGNGVDPLDIIESHGADAMRFVLCQMTTQTQDVRMPVNKGPNGKNTSPKFDIGRNFCNKLWNASRFVMGMLEGESETAKQRLSETGRAGKRSLIDRWMLSRLAAAVEQVDKALAGYEYSEYAQTLYDLMWRDFCDWYLEGIKPTVAADAGQRAVLAHAMEAIVRLLHPAAPFITEAIWERLKEIETALVAGIELGPSRKGGLLATAGWPRVDGSLRDAAAESQFERLRSLVTAIREVRAQHNVPPKRRVTLHVSAAFSREETSLIETLAGVEGITTDKAPADSAPFSFGGAELRLSNLADAVDAETERARLEKTIADASKTIATLENRLNNPGYAQKAPPAMVEQTKSQLAKAQADRDAAAASLAKL